MGSKPTSIPRPLLLLLRRRSFVDIVLHLVVIIVILSVVVCVIVFVLDVINCGAFIEYVVTFTVFVNHNSGLQQQQQQAEPPFPLPMRTCRILVLATC